MGTRIKVDEDTLIELSLSFRKALNELKDDLEKLMRRTRILSEEIEERIKKNRNSIMSLQNKINMENAKKEPEKPNTAAIQRWSQKIADLETQNAELMDQEEQMQTKFQRMKQRVKETRDVITRGNSAIEYFVKEFFGDSVNLTSAIHSQTVRENRRMGRKVESKQTKNFKHCHLKAQEQITIRTNAGTRFRIDAIGLRRSGKLDLTEIKSSETAPLTKNQRKGFEELRRGGGTVVGKGKGFFGNGYEIPKGTRVKVIRPSNL